MRPMVPLLLTLALFSAGCFGGDDPADPTPTPTTNAAPTMDATPIPNGTTPTPTTTPEVTPTPATPEPLAPRVVANQSFDFATEGDATGQAPKTKPTDAVPAGYGNLTLNVTFVRTSTGPTTLPVTGSLNTPTITLLDPDGNEAASTSATDTQAPVVLVAKPGAWTVRYEGSGTYRATVVLTANA